LTARAAPIRLSDFLGISVVFVQQWAVDENGSLLLCWYRSRTRRPLREDSNHRFLADHDVVIAMRVVSIGDSRLLKP
jgi:hypothetical protein